MDLISIYNTALRRKRVILTDAERADLLKRLKTDPKARERLIESVLPLVMRLAGEFRALSSDRFELLDLIQEGAIAAMTAVDTFKVDGGANLLTWTHLCVRTHYLRILRVANMKKRSATLVPLDVPLSEEDPAPIETLEAEELTQEEQFELLQFRQKVSERLGTVPLSASDRHLLQVHVMCDPDEIVSSERLAVMYGVTRRGIRARQERLMRRLQPHFQEFRRAA